MAESARLVDGNNGDAIQKAIDSLSGGGVVVLGPGEYLVERTIELRNDITISGAGPGKTLLRLKDHADCHMMTNAEHGVRMHHIEIRDLTLDGNMHKHKRPDGKSPLLYACGAYFKNTDEINISNIKAVNIHQTAFHFNACHAVRINGLDADYMGWSGISTSGTDDMIVTGTVVDHAGFLSIHSGIHIDGGQGVCLEARVAGASGNAVMLDSSYCPLRNVVIDCEGSDSKRGLSLSGSIKHAMENVTISGRYTHNKEIGILVSNASNVSIRQCHVGHNPEYGILLQGRQGAQGCIVSHCVFDKNGVPIGEVHESKFNYFVRNRFSGNQAEPQYKKPSARPRTPATAMKPDAKDMARVSAESAAAAPMKIDGFSGICAVCGSRQDFIYTGGSVREGYRCPSCQASLRYQGQAKLLLELCSRHKSHSLKALAGEDDFNRLWIYEPGVIGPFRKYFRELDNYFQSNYWTDVAEGEYRDGVQCQNLMALTYPDNMFDLMITSDILEHVRKPDQAYEEIRRVLKKGGMHIFSIPLQHPMPEKTISRMDTSTDKDIDILPPRYHLAPGNVKTLVYQEFGGDIIEAIGKHGLETHAVQFNEKNEHQAKLLTFYSINK